MTSFKHKPHFVQGAKYHLTPDAQREPPIECEFRIGDTVTFTNDYGVIFRDHIVTGFSPTVEGEGRFVYLDKDSWWFPVNPLNLSRQSPKTETMSA